MLTPVESVEGDALQNLDRALSGIVGSDVVDALPIGREPGRIVAFRDEVTSAPADLHPVDAGLRPAATAHGGIRFLDAVDDAASIRRKARLADYARTAHEGTRARPSLRGNPEGTASFVIPFHVHQSPAVVRVGGLEARS